MAEAMNSCFRGIINDGGRSVDEILLHKSTKAFLLQCLACIVHHADELREEGKKIRATY